ncbi:MAG: CHASE3 domain-containing protein [Alphaproteobacteria bacterium]|nr:CHASE3 domain-containing protein [Alphaproteobacteria bacterium]
MTWLLANIADFGRTHSLLRYWRYFLALGFILIVTAGAAAIYLSVRMLQMDERIQHASNVWRATLIVQDAWQDAESGQRGFLLTSNHAYLAAFEDAVRRMPQAVIALRAITADSPDERRRVGALEPMLRDKLAEMRQTIALERQGRSAAALSLVNTGRGMVLMGDIRREIGEISQVELSGFYRWRDQRAWLYEWLLALICANLLTVVLIVGYLSRGARAAIDVARSRSEQLKAEIKLRQETEETLRQVQKLESIGQLTGGIAHDFNNILTIIIGNLDTMRRRLADPSLEAARCREMLDRPVEHALQGAQSAAQLIERLLAFSRRQMLAPVGLELNALIVGMSDLLRRTLGESIEIETILADGPWPVFADPNQMESALLNLCLNARDAMPGGGRLTIATAGADLDESYRRQFGDIRPGPYALLRVSDTGCGIAPDLLERIFEPFFTTKKEGQGSGLGLAMVHGFVKQSGGHVEVNSTPGRGTTVTIYLPRHSGAVASSARSTEPDVVPRAGTGETILLVEDNDEVRRCVRDDLAELGYQVIDAPDAATAVGHFETTAGVSLLLCDIVLAGDNGSELAARLRRLRPDLPVLLMTGYARNADRDFGARILTKPFTLDVLARAVREAIDRSPAVMTAD